MTAKHRRAAGRDRSDHAPFDAPEMSDVRSFVTLTVTAEDIGQFERRPRRHPLSGRRHVQGEPIERTGGIADELRGDARIARRRRQVLVTEQNLNDADVDAALQKVSGEAMPQNVQLTRLSSPAAAAAERQAACKTVGSIGLSGIRPGNR